MKEGIYMRYGIDEQELIFSALEKCATSDERSELESLETEFDKHTLDCLYETLSREGTDKHGFFAGPEKNVADNRWASWIVPLNFEKNLLTAFDLLSELDSLYALLYKLKVDGEAFIQNESSAEKKIALKNELNDLTMSIRSKLSFKTVDLLSHHVAVRLAAKELYGIESSFVSEGVSFSLNLIRSSLRRIYENYRIEEHLYENLTIPVSVVWARSELGSKDNATFAAGGGNHTHNDLGRTKDGINFDFLGNEKGIIESEIILDCNNITEFAPYDKVIIRNIGVQCIPVDKAIENGKWGITIGSVKKTIGTGVETTTQISGETRFSNVSLNSTIEKIEWGNNPSLVGLSAKRTWKLSIDKFGALADSELGKEKKGLKDIIIHFQVQVHRNEDQ